MASSLTQLLYTARDGLTAQSYGLGVTGQNISNVNTPGYVRREAVLETRALGDNNTGSVSATGIRRATDVFIERRQYETTGLTSAASEHDKDLGNVEALFNDQSGTGLGSSLDKVFKSFSALASNPSDPTTRQAVSQAADDFATRVSDTADAIEDNRKALLQAAQTTVDEINQRARDIAKLNQQIATAEASGQTAADLRDKRAQLLLSLAGMVDTRTIASGDSLVVQVSGATLVDGAQARSLAVQLDAGGNLQIMAVQDKDAAQDVTNFLTGGTLAGIREARDVDMVAVSKQLDQFAFDVGNAINAQHAAGFGLDGVSGRKLFDLSSTVDGAARSIKLSADVAGNPNAIAASASASTLPGDSDNAAKLSALSGVAITAGGTRTASEAYGAIVGDVASRRAASTQMLETRKAISQQVDSMKESLSGVSLDEEFVNLTKFQRAYQASARLLSTADQMLQELMQRL